MKKYIALLLILVTVLSFAACGKKESAPADETLAPDATIAQTLLYDFKHTSASSMEELANKLLENKVLDFAGAVMPVEEGYLNGFSDEIHGFTEGAMFAPMIGAIPFVGYVFKTANDAAAADLVKSLTAAHDLRWNICTQADEMICEAKGDTVFFVMSPTSFEE